MTVDAGAEGPGFSSQAKYVVTHKGFDATIGICIILNSVVISLEQAAGLNGQETIQYTIIENVFLVIYILELGMRLIGFGFRHSLTDSWVRFDMFLVLFGIVTNWLLAPLVDSDLGPMMVLRTTRLLRLGKMARFFSRFREFWMLVRGLLESAGIMFYSFTLVGCLLYIIGSVSVEVITKHRLARGPQADPEFADHVDDYFPNLPVTIMTLVQFACGDNPSLIYRPLVEQDSSLALFFVGIVFFFTVVVMNLITAVIVTKSIENSLTDKEDAAQTQEERLARLVNQLKQKYNQGHQKKSALTGFKGIVKQGDDGDDSAWHDHLANSIVSREQVDQLTCELNAEDVLFLCERMHVRSLGEIFEILDCDNTGKITMQELCVGILQDVIAHQPVALKRMQKQVEAMHFKLKAEMAMQQTQEDMLRKLTLDLKDLGGHLNDLSVRLPSRSDRKTTIDGKMINLAPPSTPSTQRAPVAAKGGLQERQPSRGDRSAPLPPDTEAPPAWASDLMLEIRSIHKQLDAGGLWTINGVDAVNGVNGVNGSSNGSYSTSASYPYAVEVDKNGNADLTSGRLGGWPGAAGSSNGRGVANDAECFEPLAADTSLALPASARTPFPDQGLRPGNAQVP
eukprot:TRINITY_DN8125_c0_g1_i1.p1 TRINITY_DN8125_c0_g1~~TRINITY_DN8125_c0_g1_i1.p1  ORF type:complete len:624 (+),score=162.06 TRINITY_DN8125_c0_g1_i1:94-1965(+)